MTLQDFNWTQRSAVPIAASVILGSWAVLAGLVAAVAHLLGGEAVAAPATTIAGTLLAVVVLLLALAAFLGFVRERPVMAKQARNRSAVPISRPVA